MKDMWFESAFVTFIAKLFFYINNFIFDTHTEKWGNILKLKVRVIWWDIRYLLNKINSFLVIF